MFLERPPTETKSDPRVRRAVLPTRIVWQQGDVEGTEFLLHNDSGQALIQAKPGCRLRGAGTSLLLDFGRELHGGVQLVVGPTGDYGPTQLRLRFGESVSEAMIGPLNHHSLGDWQVAMPSMASQEFGLTGFRFVRIDLLEDRELPLTACRAMTLMRDLPPVGAFACSDERLNRVWQTGADTVHLCLQDYVWDGIKRDRAVWIGDLHPEAAVVSAVWGNLDIVPQSLDWARDHAPLPAWMNGIGSYSKWWIILQRDWYMAHGDRDYLEAQRGYLVALLPALAEQIQSDGKPQWRGRLFLDWPSSGQPEAVDAGLTALLVMALRAGAELCATLGETSTGEQALHAADRLQRPALPWPNKQASALLGLAGVHDLAEVNGQVLARDPLRGLSTFYGYYVLQARAGAGDFAGCLEVIRRYWGAMLDLGATSFWEDFDLGWTENAARIDELATDGRHDVHAKYGDHCYKGLRHSLCHGWAAGPTAWLSEHVLGVRPLSPGCRRVAVRPYLGDLDWVEGAYPTPYGPITLRHERGSNGEISSRVEAPPEVEVIR